MRRTPRVLLFHKPYGVLCQFTGEGPALRDYIGVPGVYAAGRLDRDSEGLLLLTDDGQLQHRLTDPRFEHPRQYWAQVERVPDAAAVARLRTGVAIEDYMTRPCRVRVLDAEPDLPPRDPPIRYRKNVPSAWLEMILTEGRNRQVRRMTAAVGHPTLRLVRAAIGTLTIAGLAPGAYRTLSPAELQTISGQGETRTPLRSRPY
ncbi:MAG: pseudouridine synthase [Bryobacteraceae bacterium]